MAVIFSDQEISELVEEPKRAPTDRYSDLRGGLKCLINDANVKLPSDLQGNLFGDQQQ